MYLKRSVASLLFNRWFIITSLWIAFVSLIVAITYYSIYLTNARWRTFNVAYDPIEGPMLNIWGIIALVSVSFLAGFSLKDTKPFVFGFLSTLLLSFIFSVLFGFVFIWLGLGFSETIGQIPFGWEWAFYMSLLNCFRIYVPYVLVLLIFSSGVGHLIRGYILP